MTDVDPQSIATVSLPGVIKTLWRVVALVQAAVLVAVAVAVWLLVAPWLGAVVLVVALLFLGLRWWMIDLAFARWRWGVDDRWVERRSGVVVATTHVVPRSRVQTLTTRAGPIDRWLGLSSIVVHTAGTHTPNLTIPHLSAHAAERLRTELGG